MPFMASLMDVPFKRELVEALRAACAQESPEQVEQRIKQEVQRALKDAGHALKERELDMKQRLVVGGCAGQAGHGPAGPDRRAGGM